MQSAHGIALGITGGIAAYKIPQLIRIFKKQGTDIKVVLTPAARGLVGVEALRTLSGNPVYSDDSSFYDMDHIRLAEWAKLLLICPATANTLSKLAHGIADNLLTTLALSFRESQIVLAPAMNTVMWENSATRTNLDTLTSRGMHVLPVGSGELACGISGPGRMAELEVIAEYVNKLLYGSTLFRGKKLLISSGPTEEAIDPVRVITNRSTGKMGAALAREALLMGAEVTLVSGPAQEPLPSGARIIAVRTAQEMQEALQSNFKAADICIMAAAVSDYRPIRYSQTKLQRNEQGRLVLELVPNPDILASLSSSKGGRIVVGFALESGDEEKRAVEKMEKKGCDMIVFNRADSSLGLDTTKIVILGKNGFREESPVINKQEAARIILKRIAQYSENDNAS